MTSRLPSLYNRGTDVFGCRKTPPPYNKSGETFATSLPPIPSVNDLLAIGRDEIASMKDLKDSLKCIKKLNNSSRLQRHKTKPNQKITSKDIEMFLESEQSFYNDDDTENDEDIEEEQIEQDQQSRIDDANDIESENENPSFEEEDEDSGMSLSDLISSLDGDFNSDEIIEHNEVETNHAESNIEDNATDSQIISSSSQDSNNFPPSNTNLNTLDLLQQASLEEESNIHQIDDALSFVSSMVCNNNIEISTSTSTSNSAINSPSASNSNSRSNSALVTPRNQSSRNNSARSTQSNISQQMTSTNRENSENLDQSNNAVSPRVNSSNHFHLIINRPNRRTRENGRNRSHSQNAANLLNFIFNLDS
ncbi:hypothetical protein M9Y10_023021 [Tritrichomonas musculus]|uniref:Uncharacterized protein n=1 Tax=Tritrichomonas musculus TaxID=1915356 RepID=A0ABR2KTZ3_9EUKA